MRVHETTVYQFAELSDEAKEKALEECRCWNVQDMEWWDSVYDDAATIGLKIEDFDIDRGSYCRGKWTEDAEDVARLIIENHGKTCETHQDAGEFLACLHVGQTAFEAKPEYDPEYEEYEESHECSALTTAFFATICEDYRIILQKEHEHLVSEEAVQKSIEANEIEFTEDGKRF